MPKLELASEKAWASITLDGPGMGLESGPSWGKDDVEPPGKIRCCVAGGMVGNKGVVVERSHEDFQIGKIGLASRENQAGVQQLSIKLLRLLQIVRGTGEPGLDGSHVLGSL